MIKFWKRLRILILVIFILILIFLGFFFIRGYRISTDQLENEQIDTVAREYSAIIEGNRTVALSLYENVIDLPEITALLRQAGESGSTAEKDRIRKVLYRRLLPNYDKFTHYNIQQLQFHLPDNTSFLRFNNPGKWGDDLTFLRSSVRETNLGRKPVLGFEEGVILNGYRFVFPVFHNLAHVGSVELSISMKAVTETMKKLYSRPSRFIMSRQLMEEKLSPVEMAGYASWSISDEYVLVPGMGETGFPEPYLTPQEKARLSVLLSGHPEKPAVFKTRNLESLIIFPVHNYDNRLAAYIITQSSGENNRVLRENLFFTLLFLSGMIILLLLVFILINRNYRILDRAASFDPLTGTLSRNVLFDRLQIEYDRYKRYRTPVSLVVFDLDHFKLVNDTFGHMAGDQILKIFSKAIMERARTTDFFGRLGGDEFLLVLPETGQTGAEILAEKLNQNLRTIIYPEVGRITCSVGVGEIAPGDPNIEYFIHRIDEGLYSSKKEGRNRVTGVVPSS